MRLRLLALILIPTLVTAACAPRTIRIGFSGSLTGNFADLGVQGRNGAQMAVEDINAGGGVNGRPLELLTADDTGTPEGAIAADRSLIKNGAIAIIGHMTSAISVAVLDEVTEAGSILVSPTTATTLLSGRDDGFFRTISDITAPSRAFARHIYTDEGITRLALIYDMDNEAYAKIFSQHFAAAFEDAGGRILAAHEVYSGRDPDWPHLLQQIAQEGAEAVFVALSAFDLSHLAQYNALAPDTVRIFSAPWAYTTDILEYGGAAVDGIQFVAFYAEDNPQPVFQNFKRRYTDRFGRVPNFASAFSYEAVYVIYTALMANKGKTKNFARRIPNLKIKGVLGDFTIDQFGDVDRADYIVTIDDGQFATLQVLP